MMCGRYTVRNVLSMQGIMKNTLALVFYLISFYSYSANIKTDIEYDAFTDEISSLSVLVYSNEGYGNHIQYICTEKYGLTFIIISNGKHRTQTSLVTVKYRINEDEPKNWVLFPFTDIGGLSRDPLVTRVFDVFWEERTEKIAIKLGEAKTQIYTLSQEDKNKVKEYLEKMIETPFCKM